MAKGDSKASAGTDRLKGASQDLFKAVGDRAVGSVSGRVGGLTERLQGIADGEPLRRAGAKAGEAKVTGKSPVKGAVKGALSGVKDTVTGAVGKVPGLGKGGKDDEEGKGEEQNAGAPAATKATNIVEQIDVGVPIEVAYNQWTEFGAFPTFMKKVENVDAEEDNKLEWKAKILWSHRTWKATILEQVPEDRIVWRSKGEKGHVDGAVTFHELGPNLTRIILVLEYYPQGLFERTGNLWRAQGRRARVELEHFRRHVMTRTILEPDEVEGWRGEIRDAEVVTSHDEALDEQESEDEGTAEDTEEPEEEPVDEEPTDEESEGEPTDESEEEPEDEYEEPEDEETEDEYEESADEEPEDEEPEDEYEESADEEPEDEAEEAEEPEEAEDEAEEPEDEYADEEPADEEEPTDEDETEGQDEEPAPRRRRRAG